MERLILDKSRIHPAIQQTMSDFYKDVIDEVAQAVDQHDVLIICMAQNPFCKKAHKLLQEHGIKYHAIEYGSYFSEWRKRGALKMWSGWPTFPMVFVKGQLIGGFDDAKKMIESKQMDTLLSTG